MSQKRMFDRAIIDTDRFMDMGLGAKALYFLLGMEADDEGFVSYKKVMRVHGGQDDDLNVLLAKRFILKFPSGVVVVTDWNSNNYLDKNRIKSTEYQTEKKLLVLTEDNKYEFNNGLTSIEERSIEEKRIEKPVTLIKSVSYLRDIPQEDMQEFVTRFDATARMIKSKAEDLELYCTSKGKRYANYKSFLLNALKKDFKPRPKQIAEVQVDEGNSEKTKQAREEISKMLADKMRIKS